MGTPAVVIVENLRKTYGRTVAVEKHAPFVPRRGNPRELQNRIGVQLQEAQLQKRIKV